MSVYLLLWLLALAFSCSIVVAQPLSPISSDADLPASKYTEQDVLMIEDVLFGTDVTHTTAHKESRRCTDTTALRLDLLWMNHAETSIYATPVIDDIPAADSHSDIVSNSHIVQKHVILPGYHHHLNVLDADGHHLPSSPLVLTGTSAAYFHTSPIMFDYNRDGVKDIVWVNINGQVLIINGQIGQEPQLLAPIVRIPKLKVRKKWYEGLSGTDARHKVRPSYDNNKQVYEEEEEAETASRQYNNRSQASPARRRLLQLQDDVVFNHLLDNLPEEARASLLLFSHSPEASIIPFDEHDENEYAIHPDYVFVDAHILATPLLIDYNQDGREQELLFSVSYYFDADEYANNPHLFSHLSADVDIHQYVAGGLYVLDLDTVQSLFSIHLDLTTDSMSLTAMIYTTPSFVDLDGDGSDEVIVGTSLGMVYVLDAITGNVRDGFPVVMSEVQAQIVVEDVNGDGLLELIIMDSLGNVVCVDIHGREVWHHMIAGFASQPAAIGDVNGDGILDVVMGTVSGQVWALHGTNGSVLPHFPLKTNGKIIAPITLVNLDSEITTPTSNLSAAETLRARANRATGSLSLAMYSNHPTRHSHLHLVFPSFDGHIYIVHGKTGCATKLDLGEQSYAAVLVDDLLHSHHLDLLIATMSGNIYAFQSDAAYHPQQVHLSQSSSSASSASTVYAYGYHGIFFTSQTRAVTRHRGMYLFLSFVISDARKKLSISVSSVSSLVTAKYNVSIWFDDDLLYQHFYYSPGEYQVKLHAPARPRVGVLHIKMYNEHRQLYDDRLLVAVNVYWYRSLKYLVFLPFVFMCVLLLLLKPAPDSSLPT